MFCSNAITLMTSDNPLIVKAAGVAGRIPTDAIIAAAGADLIASLDSDILKQCKVAFLID